MAISVSKVQVWAGDIVDQPGGLDMVLGKLAEAGANLECVIARRQPDKPGTGVVFVTPIKGRKVQQAAAEVGLKATDEIITLRIEGDDKPGIGHKLTDAIAETGVNLRGMTAAVLGRKFISYLSIDTTDEANKAIKALRALNGKRRR